MTFKHPIVSVQWLNDNLHLETLVILDASLSQVGSHSNITIPEDYIPNSYFFDLKNEFSDSDSIFPSTVPTLEQFEFSARKLGLNNDSLIVVYDNIGVYSSPRAWWLFKLMGLENVAVLNGGLPAWKKAGLQVENTHRKSSVKGNFSGKLQQNLLANFDDIVKTTSNYFVKIIDARSSDRFKGLQPEPRKELRSGTIPNSINFPFTEVLNGYEFLEGIQLKAIFNSRLENAEKNTHLIFSCGSGITACILALAADCIGYRNYSVYDGSWTEYGTLKRH